MKTQIQIRKSIEAHHDEYKHAEKYIHTNGIRLTDVFSSEEGLRITGENLNGRIIYLRVEGELLTKTENCIRGPWEPVLTHSF